MYQTQLKYNIRSSQKYCFTFTGKERDSETGFSYFGARYYDSDILTGWLSVDPLADKYPSLSPYAYCAWNPVKLVDPDGRMIDDYFSTTGNYLGSDNANTRNIRIIKESDWNELSKDVNGLVEHCEANIMSVQFSAASSNGMTEEAQLKVYDYYNFTGVNIYSKIYFNKDGSINNKIGGMILGVKKNMSMRIGIYIKGNIYQKVCDNAYNIINMYSHELDHIFLARKIGFEVYSKKSKEQVETQAINAQKKHYSWVYTSESYKKSVEEYLNSIKNESNKK